jgi:hypothetical protein
LKSCFRNDFVALPVEVYHSSWQCISEALLLRKQFGPSSSFRAVTPRLRPLLIDWATVTAGLVDAIARMTTHSKKSLESTKRIGAVVATRQLQHRRNDGALIGEGQFLGVTAALLGLSYRIVGNGQSGSNVVAQAKWSRHFDWIKTKQGGSLGIATAPMVLQVRLYVP